MQNIRFLGLAIILTLFCGFLFTKNLSMTVQSSSSELTFEKETTDKPTLKVPKSLDLFVLVHFSYNVFSKKLHKNFRHQDVKDTALVQKLLRHNYISLPPPLHT